MKAGNEHRVPLSDRALAILKELHRVRTSGFAFPGFKRGLPLSNMALEAVLRRAKIDVTTHGFRSSFRDWAGDHTAFARDVVEAALSHAIRDIEEVKKAIQFDPKTCLWTIIGDAEVVQRSAARSTVIKALEEANGEPLGAQQIAAATGMKPANVRQLLATMKREDLITATSTYGKYVIAGARTERPEV